MDIRVYREHFEQETRHWWFRGRRKIVTDLLDRSLPRQKGRILDVGCGTGGMLPELRRYGDVRGIDPSPEAVEFCRMNGFPDTACGDLRSYPDTGRFDLICYFDVLEHIEDDTAELKEIYQHLKPGGYAVFTVPAYQFLWSGHDVILRHYRRYTRNEMGQKLKKAGFFPIHDTYFNFFLFLPIAGFRLLEKMFGGKGTPESSDLGKTTSPMNRILEPVFSAERFFLRFIRVPFGVSLFYLVRRPEV